MSARWYAIGADTHQAIKRSAAYDGPRVILTDKLGPAIWAQVKTVLEKLGAVYVIGASAFEFEPDQDARTIVMHALADGRVMAQANAAGYVPTPAVLAEDIVRHFGELSAPRGRKLRVLEPSAGIGRFVQAITSQLPTEFCQVTAVECDARRARQIPAGLATVVVDTFEAYARRAMRAGQRFDVVAMNPPFAVPGNAQLWAEHVLLAWSLLAPGGRLVAIVPASALDTRHARSSQVREVAELLRLNGSGEQLERDAFAESGITVGTAVIWLDKTLTDVPAPPPLVPPAHPWVFRAYTGEEIPVPVARPFLTRNAARTMPVQVWRDGWRGRDRVLRYRAECAVCAGPVWMFDDGENDPRGVLGNNSGGWSLDAEDDFGLRGMTVGLCAVCGNDGAAYAKALPMAKGFWAQVSATLAAVKPPTPAPPAAVALAGEQPALFVDVWDATIAALVGAR